MENPPRPCAPDSYLLAQPYAKAVADNWWQTELGGPALGLGTPPTMSMRPGNVAVALEASDADVVNEQGTSAPAGMGGQLLLKRPFPAQLQAVVRNRGSRLWAIAPHRQVRSGYRTTKRVNGNT
jgi:acyl-coenzyme A synthetase/AMP-(fatty) acid ligase